jgi:hypothetical protein
VWVVCTYDANALPDPVLEGMWRTHPEVLGDDWHASDHFEDPRELVRKLSRVPEPLPELRSFSASDDLEIFRERLARELMAENVPDAKALEMLGFDDPVAGYITPREGTGTGLWVARQLAWGSSHLTRREDSR